MKIDIISGFLGAGKTTLIKKLLSEELSSEKIAIIENEYGEVSIDGNLFKDEKVEVKEISSGCICCSIKGDFKDSINEIIRDYAPTRIIVEPSGVAKLSEVISSINEAKIPDAKLNMIATVLDVNNFDSYFKNFGEFYKNQISNAKVVLLSRVDSLNAKEIVSISEKIKAINKNVRIITTPWSKLHSKRIIEIAELPKDKLDMEIKASKFSARLKASTSASQMFDNWGVETSISFDEKKLNLILNKLSDKERYGEVLRAKGIIPTKSGKWVQFDYVPNEVRIKNFSTDYTGRICVIGKNLNSDSLKNLFLNSK